MPTYHFVREIPRDIEKTTIDEAMVRLSQVERVRAVLDGNGTLKEAVYCSAPVTANVGAVAPEVLSVINSHGSMILVDLARLGVGELRKLHAGEVRMKFPHVETYERGIRAEGAKSCSRIDLAELDPTYASHAVEYFKTWKSNQRRREIAEGYSLDPETREMQTVNLRVRQLSISQEGLERQIERLQRKMRKMEGKENPRRVSKEVGELEDLYAAFLSAMDDSANTFRRSAAIQKGRPNIVVSEEVNDDAQLLHIGLSGLLDYLNATIMPEEAREGERYWQNIAAWEHM